jgi:DNA-binding HxlR family transcriptional regulator
MVTRHGAKKFIIAALPEIKKLLEKGYTVKEIHADLTELTNNISYSTLLRNLQKMGISEKKPHQEETPKVESQESHSIHQAKREMTNAERNLEKLTNRKPKFSYDSPTKGKDFY